MDEPYKVDLDTSHLDDYGFPGYKGYPIRLQIYHALEDGLGYAVVALIFGGIFAFNDLPSWSILPIVGAALFCFFGSFIFAFLHNQLYDKGYMVYYHLTEDQMHFEKKWNAMNRRERSFLR